MIINVFKVKPENLWFLDKDDERLLECASSEEISTITIQDLIDEKFKYCDGLSLQNIPNNFTIEILTTDQNFFIVKLNNIIIKDDKDNVKLFRKASSIGGFLKYGL